MISINILPEKKNHYNLQKEKIYYIACKGINLLYKFAYGEL